MSLRPKKEKPKPRVLEEEELFLLDSVVKNAKISYQDGSYNLVVPASQMLVDLLKAIRLTDESSERTKRPRKKVVVRVEEPECQSDDLTLAEAIVKFMANGPLWGEGTREHYARATQILIDVIGGSTPLRQITPSDIAKVKEIAIALPQQHYAHFSHVPIEEAVAIAKKKGLKTRALSTVGREIYGITVFFNWCISQWFIERSPAQKITIPKHLMKWENAREAFLMEDLVKMFKAPLYTGCRNDGWFYDQVGVEKPRNTRFWMPLIALFSGMRLGEIAQLTTANVVPIEGILCFKIAPTKSPDGSEMLLKTNSARRNIPVHSELLLLGFREWVQKKNGKLFPDLSSTSLRKNTTYYSRWFANQFLGSLDMKGRKLSFHSFRHNFRDALREGAVGADFVNMLGGWAPRVAANRYGRGRAPILLREIEKVRYPGLDLRHLHVDIDQA
jgi:integrase